MTYVHNLAGIFSRFTSSTTSALDLSDILRAELVLGVSTLDHYIHSIVEEGMLEIYQGNRKPTDSFNKFNVDLANIPKVIQDPLDTNWLKNQIHKNLSHQSFQKSNKISAILKLFSDKNIWSDVAILLKMNKNHVTLQLDLIIDRRNKIAHEADVEPTYPGKRWTITEKMVNGSIIHIENICEKIFLIVK